MVLMCCVGGWWSSLGECNDLVLDTENLSVEDVKGWTFVYEVVSLRNRVLVIMISQLEVLFVLFRYI